MNKNNIYRIYAFTVTLLLMANIIPGYTAPYTDKKKQYSKKSVDKYGLFKKEQPEHFLRTHFKNDNVWKVKTNQDTDLKYVIQLNSNRWQHFITKINGANIFRIINEFFAQRVAGSNTADLNPAAKFIGGVYATVTPPGQSSLYLHEKDTNTPTAPKPMSKYKYVDNNNKQIRLKYRIINNNLIISDDKNQEIGCLKLEKVDLKKLDTKDSKYSTKGSEYAEKLNGIRDGKTKAEVNYIVEKIEDIKNNNQYWKKNARIIKSFVNDAVLDPNFSNQSNIKLNKKTKEELDKIIEKIRAYIKNNKKWSTHLDQIVTLIDKTIMG